MVKTLKSKLLFCVIMIALLACIFFVLSIEKVNAEATNPTIYVYEDGSLPQQFTSGSDLTLYDETTRELYNYYTYDPQTQTTSEEVLSISSMTFENGQEYHFKLVKSPRAFICLMYEFVNDNIQLTNGNIVSSYTFGRENDGYEYYYYDANAVDNKIGSKLEDTYLTGEPFSYPEDTPLADMKDFYYLRVKQYNIRYYENENIYKTDVVTRLTENYEMPDFIPQSGYKSLGWRDKNTGANISTIDTTKLNDNIDLVIRLEKAFKAILSYNPDSTDSKLISLFDEKITTKEYPNVCMTELFAQLVQNKIKGYKILYSYDNWVSINGKLTSDIENYDFSSVTELNLIVNIETTTYTIAWDLGNVENATELQKNLPTKYDINDTYIIIPSEISRSGYDILSIKVYKENVEILDITETKEIQIENLDELCDIKIEVAYNPKTYSVTFTTTFDPTKKHKIDIKYYSKISNIDDYRFNIPGYTFDKWVNKDGDTYTAESIMKTVGGLVIYAQYIPNKYKITINDGYSQKPKDHEVTYNEPYSIISLNRPGYNFINYMHDDIVYPLNGKYNIVGDININAVWEAKEYKITIIVRDKTVEQNVTFDQPCNILTDIVKANSNLIVGFYRNDDLIAGRTGDISKYSIPEDIIVNAIDFTDETFLSDIYNKITFNFGSIKTPNLYLNEELVDINNQQVFNLTKIGNYKLTLYSGNTALYSKEFVLHADLGIENNKIYTEPVTFNKVNAKILVDGKEISQNDFRLTKNGKHNIKVLGVNGYVKEYNIEYKNYNILYAVIMTCIAFLTAIGTGIMIFTGRKNLIKYDNSNRE